jgi:hypothetical protein
MTQAAGAGSATERTVIAGPELAQDPHLTKVMRR